MSQISCLEDILRILALVKAEFFIEVKNCQRLSIIHKHWLIALFDIFYRLRIRSKYYRNCPRKPVTQTFFIHNGVEIILAHESFKRAKRSYCDLINIECCRFINLNLWAFANIVKYLCPLAFA